MENQNKTMEQIRTEEVWEAARTGKLEEMRRLIENTAANMQARDQEYNSALHYGVLSGQADVVRYLVERVGLNPLSANNKGETPWDLAYRENKGEILDYLEQRLGCSYEDTYHNPVRRGFCPDPSIVRVGEDYYMVNSTFMFFPCISVSHSRDLVHWKIIGYAVTNPKWSGLDGLCGGMGYWAPDISYCDGCFYIAATLRMNDDMEKRRVQMVTSSHRPEGPYEEPVFLDDDGIDPSIFHDDDGRKYMVLNKGARIRELSKDCKSFLSPASMLWYGDCKRKPEGPHLLKYKGYYYLFLAEGGTGKGHRITAARSKTLMGPYEPSPHNPVLRQWDDNALIQCCGHGKPVQLPDGRWYVVYLCLRMLGTGDGTGGFKAQADTGHCDGPDRYGILGRETALDPLTWTAEGWPLINHGRGPSDQQILPFAGKRRPGDNKNAVGDEAGEDAVSYFVGEGQQTGGQAAVGGYPRWKNRDWMTPRPLYGERLCLEAVRHKEHLRLKGQEGDLNTKEFRSVFVTRQEEFDLEAWCDLVIPRLLEGQSLGMTCYYDENSYIKYGVCMRDHSLGLCLQEYAGDGYVRESFIPFQDCLREGLSDRQDAEGHRGNVISSLEAELSEGGSIRLSMRAEGLARTFFCMIPKDGVKTLHQEKLENTSYLSSEGLKKGKRFTGATLGIYVQGEVWGEFTDWQISYNGGRRTDYGTRKVPL